MAVRRARARSVTEHLTDEPFEITDDPAALDVRHLPLSSVDVSSRNPRRKLSDIDQLADSEEFFPGLHAEIGEFVRYAFDGGVHVLNIEDEVGNTPEEFSAQIKRDVARWAKVIRDAGIKQIE